MADSSLRTSLATLAWTRPTAAVRSALTGGAGLVWPAASPVSHPIPLIAGIGDLEVRLAADRREVRRAQRVRYKVFFEHGRATPSASAALTRRDVCPFDAICDHLVVVDHAAPDRRTGGSRPRIVGTYRLLRQDVAERHGGFYTAREFDIAPLLARHPGQRFLELGRSCALPRYRGKRTIELLWRGIWAYAQHHRMDVLIGCASFEGVDPDALLLPLTALRHFAAAEPEWQAAPLRGRETAIAAIPADHLDRREALASLPPLIKGYLRAGARFGDGVVVDEAFGTMDVLAVLPLAQLDGRYLAHFGSA